LILNCILKYVAAVSCCYCLQEYSVTILALIYLARKKAGIKFCAKFPYDVSSDRVVVVVVVVVVAAVVVVVCQGGCWLNMAYEPHEGLVNPDSQVFYFIYS
jgi:hypothetical protein